MIDWLPGLISAFTLGLLGSGHCLGMCGGLMGALSLAAAPGERSRWQLMLGYSLGRVLSYALAGLILGSLGLAVAQTPAITALRTLAALLLVAMGLYLAGWWHGLIAIEALGRGLWRYVQPLSKPLLPVRGLVQALGLGAVWGWLPCGLVYSALLWSAAQGNALQSAVSMLAFGLGTCPLMLATGYASQGLRTWLRRQRVRRATGLLVLGFGLWSLPGPHRHWLMGLMG